MASAHTYSGPMSLENSKYASPILIKAFPSSSSMTSVSKPATPATNTAMATSEQVAATHHAPTTRVVNQHNSDTQLAIAHGIALKEEVDKHAARFSTVVSAAVTNIHRLLELIREASSDSAKATVDTLWKELNDIYEAVNDAKAALPVFLEKQRNNVSLYHASMVNQVMQDTQHELNIQHKKVNLQHNLILEHQEAFQTFKEQNAIKLRDMETLNERISRLTLEKGNLRTEVDKYTQLLEKERSVKEEALSKVATLQKEVETLTNSNSQLLTMTNTLRKRQDDLVSELKLVQQEAESRFAAELKSATEKLAEETKNITALQTTITKLREHERAAKLEAARFKDENKALCQKYDHLAAEHAKAFTKLNEHVRETNSLRANLERLQHQNSELQQQVAKLADVETRLAQLTNANSGLTKDVSSLTSELNAARDEATKAKTEHEALLKKVESSSTKDTEHVDPGTSRLVSEQTQKIAALQGALQEWTDLAKRSFQEYQELLPLSRQAEQLRKDVVQKDETIKELQEKLASATGSQSTEDARYWKDKYENLLDSVSK